MEDVEYKHWTTLVVPAVQYKDSEQKKKKVVPHN